MNAADSGNELESARIRLLENEPVCNQRLPPPYDRLNAALTEFICT